MKSVWFLFFVTTFVWNGFAQIETTRFVSIVNRLHLLETKAATFWIQKGLDTVYGGFYATLTRNGAKTSPTNKGIVQEARHLWMFSTYYQRRDSSLQIKTIADNLYTFIVKNFLDTTTNEFYTTVTESGVIKDKAKQLYMDGFAMYALSQYAITFKKPEAAQYALNCFNAIDKRCHDAINGGYFQTSEPNFLAYGGAKETNTQMHLMETFTTLYEATKDPLVKLRLIEMVTIMTTKVKQQAGYNSLEFENDWTPVAPAIVSYGHDLEAAWLLMEAARVLDIPSDTSIRACAKTIGLFSAEKGWHQEKGGYFSTGQVEGRVTDSTKIWWVQAEAIEGLYWMYKFTKDTIHINRLESTLTWIEHYQLNAAAGEWYNVCKPNGTVSGTTNMGDSWKASYHSMRSLMFTQDWIKQDYNLAGKSRALRNSKYQKDELKITRLENGSYRFGFVKPGKYKVDIVDIKGCVQKTFFADNNQMLAWNAPASGVYFVRVHTSDLRDFYVKQLLVHLVF